MAANEIKLTLRVNDDGTLGIVGKEAKEAAAGVDELDKSTKKASKSQDRFNKGAKGVAGATSNATKGFSKMRNEIGGGSSGLVAAYATLAANVFAATAAFGALQRAAQVDTLRRSLVALGEESGRNLTVLAENLKDVTGNAISMEQALKTASLGTSAGFNTQTLENLAGVARKAASALGRDIGDATDRLIRGVAKLEPEILDELGILVRLDDAASKYAARLGVTTDSLSQFQRTQAFANATIEQGLEKYAALENVELSGFSQLSGTFQDLAESIFAVVARALDPLASFLADSKVALFGLLAALTKGIVSQALPFLTQFANKAKEAAVTSLGLVDAEKKRAESAAAAYRKLLVNVKYLSKSEKELVSEMKAGTLPLEETIALTDKLNARLVSRQNALKSVGEKTAKRYRKEIQALQEQIPLQERLIQLEKQRAGLAGGTRIKTAESKFAGRESKILTSLDDDMSFKNFRKQLKLSTMSGAQFRMSMKDAGKSTFIFGKSIPFLSKGLATGSVAFKSFGLTARVALKGITYAIPIFGQLVFAFELLKGAVSSVIDFFAGFTGAQDAVSKSSEQLNEVMNTYSDVMSKVGTETKKATIDVIRQGSALDELVTAMRTNEVAQKQAEKNATLFGRALMVLSTIGRGFASDLADSFLDIGLSMKLSMAGLKVTWFEAMDSMSKSFTQFILDPVNGFLKKFGQEPITLFDKDGDYKGLAQAKADLKDLEDMSDLRLTKELRQELPYALTEAGSSFSVFRKILEEGGDAANELSGITGTLNINDFVENFNLENLSKFPKALRDIVAQVNTTDSAFLDNNELLEIYSLLVDRGTQKTRELSAATQGLKSSIKDSEEEVSKFLQSFKGSDTAFSKVLDKLTPLAQGFSSLQEAGKDAAIIEQLKAMPESLSKFLGIQKNVTAENVNIVHNFVNQLALMDKLSRSEKRRLDVIKQYRAVLKTVTKENTAALEKDIDLNNQSATIQLDLINHQIDLQRKSLGLKQGEVVTQQTLLEATSEQAPALATLLDLQNKQRTAQNSIILPMERKHKLDLLGVENQKKALKVAKEIEASKAKELKLQQSISNIAIGKGTGQTETQVFNARIKAAELSVIVAEAEVGFTQDRLNLELEILKIKLKSLATSPEQIEQIDKIVKEQERLNAVSVKGAKARVASAKAELGILQLSRNTSIQSVLGTENTTAGVAATLTNVEKVISRFRTETGKTGILTVNKQKLEKQLQQAIEARDKALAVAPSGTSLTKPLEDNVASLQNQLVQANAAIGQASLSIIAESVAPLITELNKLGPQGEVIAAVAQGAFAVSSAWITASASIKEAIGTTFSGEGGEALQGFGEKWKALEPKQKADIMVAGLQATSAALSSINSIMSASSNRNIKNIDAQIALEKKRDGQSAQSVQKLATLEKKKEAMERKAFERNKKMMIAQAIMSTAAGAIGVYAGVKDISTAAIAAVASGAIIALGAAQVAMIASQSFNGGGGTPSAGNVPSSVSMGSRSNVIDVSQRASGGELAYMRGARGVGTNANDFTPAFTGAKYRASGGETAGYVVGEQGPELFVPETPGRIVPNDDIAQAAPVNVTFSVQAIDANSFNDALATQRGNIISMIREAANSSGEGFLETVDTDSLQMER